MTRVRKDIAATVLTSLAVLVFFATHEGWNVWLIGGSHRWAAGAIGILGIAACGLGSRAKGISSMVLATLGIAALALLVLSVVTGSLTPLSLLVVDVVVLWFASTAMHVSELRHRAVPH